MGAKWVRANVIRRRRARATRAPSSREGDRGRRRDARTRELTSTTRGVSARAHGREHGGFLARIHG